MVEFVICFKDYAELLMLCKALLSTSQQGYQSKSGKKNADGIQGEWRSSILNCLPVYLFFVRTFFFF